jgi:tetratricopeptide (TPR) repeat protein
MSVFKCKMCGGALEIKGNETVAVCEYCGTKQTLPRLDDDKKANLYDRANHFRRNNDFDKAMAIYEQILNEDNTDAEAYWSLVLCRYGIEYVEDPSSHKRIPTVNRAQFTSVFDDDNYKSALRYADAAQREVYEEEAKAINEIQKGILAISQKEEPFDVFICYKETDSNGRRTQDSVLANDLYHQLRQEGFKVFFSRITLEDKLGSAYEPYIFAALNSAKVMVVLGTKPEYFNAVWVKNEWSRYLALVKQSNGKKMLIPAYRDMDPYDLPEEFSHLQAQDMSKLGFMQDLIRGIKKIISVGTPKAAVKETVVINGGNSNTAPLLKRAFMFLEDGNWEEADEYCEKVLDQDPENAQAYLGKLMAELRVRKQEQLAECEETFENNGNYQKALRFGSKEFQSALKNIAEQNKSNIENLRLTEIYNNVIIEMDNADTENSYKAVAEKFKAIGGFKDADGLARQCFENAEVCRKDSIYEAAVARKNTNSIKSLEEAVAFFKSISGWKDSEEQIYDCQRKIEEINVKKAEELRKAEERYIAAEKSAKKRKKAFAIGTSIVCVCIVFVIVLATFIIPSIKYSKTLELCDLGKYNEAITAFEELNGYKDSADRASELYEKYKYEKLKAAEVGDYIFFGSYEQDNDTSNGKEYIEWLVLEVKDGKVLLISKYALDCQPYNTVYENVTWETCTLRKWLNNDFINAAFSADEKDMIPTVTVYADTNSEYSTNLGNATQDQVFLLSVSEAINYFNSDDARKCKPTDYAVANNSGLKDGEKWWWLRSPGEEQENAAIVISDGVVYLRGHLFVVDRAVRPALWIDLA